MTVDKVHHKVASFLAPYLDPCFLSSFSTLIFLIYIYKPKFLFSDQNLHLSNSSPRTLFRVESWLINSMMYSSKSNEYQKFSSSPPPPTAPPAAQFSQNTATTGIPVSSTNQYYSQNPPPAAFTRQAQALQPWSTGLCDCGSDVRNCCITCWCPCITFGQIAEIVDKGSSACGSNGALYTLIACVTGCPFFYSCFYRSKLRQQYLLKESPCGDCLVHCFCESCALCQEYRELKNRGFEISLGWHGNMERQSRGVAMAPVVQDGMSR